MRYALGVEYDGSSFQGWQGLGPGGPPTVQAALEAALSSVADQAITVEAGAVLQNVQAAAAEAGRLFPLSLAL